eukprot:6750008-Pyramimonas_sp.AAC.1
MPGLAAGGPQNLMQAASLLGSMLGLGGMPMSGGPMGAGNPAQGLQLHGLGGPTSNSRPSQL